MFIYLKKIFLNKSVPSRLLPQRELKVQFGTLYTESVLCRLHHVLCRLHRVLCIGYCRGPLQARQDSRSYPSLGESLYVSCAKILSLETNGLHSCSRDRYVNISLFICVLSYFWSLLHHFCRCGEGNFLLKHFIVCFSNRKLPMCATTIQEVLLYSVYNEVSGHVYFYYTVSQVHRQSQALVILLCNAVVLTVVVYSIKHWFVSVILYGNDAALYDAIQIK